MFYIGYGTEMLGSPEQRKTHNKAFKRDSQRAASLA